MSAQSPHLFNTSLSRSKSRSNASKSTRRGIASEFPDEPITFKLYPARWLVLVVCCLLSLTNGMQWISYSTLSAETEVFYCEKGTECQAAFITNQIFQLVAVFTGLAGMYLTDHYGIRPALITGCSFNFFGSLLRLASSHPMIDDPSSRQWLLHSGSLLVSVAQAAFLVLPPKIAQNWFPEESRAISNVATFVANPAGVAMGVMFPQLFFGNKPEEAVHFPRDSMQLFYFNLVMSVLSCMAFLFCLLIRSSDPPSAPSISGERDKSPPFGKALVMCFRNGQFIVQMFTFAFGFALLWGLMVILPDILIARGYTLGGYPSAACAFAGIFSSFLAGVVADRTQKLTEIVQLANVGFLFSALGLRLFLELERNSLLEDVLVLVLCCLLGAFAVPMFPIGAELGVETTFPVYEATSSGLLVLSGQLWMLFLYGLFEGIKKIDFLHTVDHSKIAGNWRLVMDLWVGFALVSMLIATFFLHPIYKRREYEVSSLTRLTENSRRTMEL